MGMQVKLNGVGDVHQLFNGDGAVLEFEHGNEDEDGVRIGLCVGMGLGSRWG